MCMLEGMTEYTNITIRSLLEVGGDAKLRRLETSLKSNFDGNKLMQLFVIAKRRGIQVWLKMDFRDQDTHRLLHGFSSDALITDVSRRSPANWVSLEGSGSTPPTGQPFFLLHFDSSLGANWWVTSELTKVKFSINLRDA